MLKKWILVAGKGAWGLEVKRESRGKGVIYILSLLYCSNFYLLNVFRKRKIKA